jgi:AcrR family transcriptional regulator
MPETVALSKGERTRQAILEAAARLILSQGYHGTSMRQIAQGAGIAVGGIYNHFASKEAIYMALLEQHQPYSDVAIGLSDLSGENVVELVEGAARLIIDQALADPVFIRLAFTDLQEFEGDTVFQLATRMIQGLMAFAGSLVASGQVRQDLSLPVLARSFAGLVVFYVISEVVASHGGSSRVDLPFEGEIDWVSGMVDVYLNGVLRRQAGQAE